MDGMEMPNGSGAKSYASSSSMDVTNTAAELPADSTQTGQAFGVVNGSRPPSARVLLRAHMRLVSKRRSSLYKRVASVSTEPSRLHYTPMTAATASAVGCPSRSLPESFSSSDTNSDVVDRLRAEVRPALKSCVDELLIDTINSALYAALPQMLAPTLPKAMSALLPGLISSALPECLERVLPAVLQPQLQAAVQQAVRGALEQAIADRYLAPPASLPARANSAPTGANSSSGKVHAPTSPDIASRSSSVAAPPSPTHLLRGASPGNKPPPNDHAATHQQYQQQQQGPKEHVEPAGSNDVEATVASQCLPSDLLAALAEGGNKRGGRTSPNSVASAATTFSVGSTLHRKHSHIMGATQMLAAAASASSSQSSRQVSGHSSHVSGLSVGFLSGTIAKPSTASNMSGTMPPGVDGAGELPINLAEVQQKLAQARALDPAELQQSLAQVSALGIALQQQKGAAPGARAGGGGGGGSTTNSGVYAQQSPQGSLAPSAPPSEAPEPIELHMDQLSLSGQEGAIPSSMPSRRASFSVMGGSPPGMNNGAMAMAARHFVVSGGPQGGACVVTPIGLQGTSSLPINMSLPLPAATMPVHALQGAQNAILPPAGSVSFISRGMPVGVRPGMPHMQGGQQLAGLANMLQAQQQQQQQVAAQAQMQAQVAQVVQQQHQQAVTTTGMSSMVLQGPGPRPAGAVPSNAPLLSQDAYMALVQASPAVAQELLNVVSLYQDEPAQAQHLLWVIFSELRAVAMECPDVAMALMRTLQRHHGMAQPTDIDQRVMGRLLQLMRHGPSGRQLCIVGLEQWSDGLGRITKKTAYLDTILHNNQMTHKKLWSEAGDAVHNIDMRLPRQLLNDVPVPGLMMLSAELANAAQALPDMQPRRWSDDAVWALKQLYSLACITAALPAMAGMDQSAAAATAGAEPTSTALDMFGRDVKDLLSKVATDAAAALAAARGGLPPPQLTGPPPTVGRFAALVQGSSTGGSGGPSAGAGRGTAGGGSAKLSSNMSLPPMEEMSQYVTFTSRLFEVLRRSQLRYFHTYMGCIMPGVYTPMVEQLLVSCPQDLLVPQYAEVVGAVAQLLQACQLSANDFDPWFWDDLYRCIDHFGIHEAVRRLRSGLLSDSPIRTFTHKNKALSHIIKGMGQLM